MKTVVITGVSRGIGLATAELFLKKGWRVIGTSVHGEQTLKNKQLCMHALNLSDSKQIAAFSYELPQFDVLINNAAVLLEAWDDVHINMNKLKETFAINVFGTIELTEQCLSKMKPDGQIINISSGWGTFSSNDSAYQPHYKMSKASLNMYTTLLAERLPDVIISAFDPGWVKTDMGTEHATKRPEDTAKELYHLINKNKKSGLFWQAYEERAW
jgi:NAD(P)-dependent dehydrogenase (short-subunit alcohol dehydrogenase family)